MNIAALVSGGVDSSVALRLLQQEGYKPTAFYLKIWLEDELSYLGECPWTEDLQYVQAVCEQAGVPLEVVSLQDVYWQEVVKYTIDEVRAGRTPNPDMLCNQRVKFGAFLKGVGSAYDLVATGHYARVIQTPAGTQLHMSPDPIKDQTYFLAQITQAQLNKAIFPIGHLLKPQVRELAQRFDLPNKDRKDSQGICFLGKFKFSDFIKHHVGTQKGELIEVETGAVMGEHEGFWFYTIGQRSGLGLSGGPWYVAAKDVAKNIVYISRSYYDEHKKRDTFRIAYGNWFGDRPESGIYGVKIRHGAQIHQAQVDFDQEGATIKLAERDQGIAPGQFAVLYSESRCMGSAVIESVI